MTHLSDQGFDRALDVYDGSVLASQRNGRTLVPDPRPLTGEPDPAAARAGGVIGTTLDAGMRYPSRVRGEASPQVVGPEAMIDYIDRVS